VATHTCGIVLAAAVWTLGHFASRREHLPSTRSAMLSGVASLSLLATLVVGQLAYEPDMYRIDSADTTPMASGKESSEDKVKPTDGVQAEPAANGTANPSAESAHATQKPALSRIVKLHKTKTTLDAYEHPVLGSPDAEHVVVKLFDYGCHHCRDQHFQIEEARKILGSRLAVLVLPVPMNRSCNAFAPVVSSGPQMQSCVFARSAIAVWRTDRTKFADFHHWLFEPEKPRTSDEVRSHLQEVAGAAAVTLADNSLDVRKQIEDYTNLYDALGRGKIPKLVGPTFLIDGRFRDGKQLAEVLEGQWQRAAR
jgi:protein-disulfide isomerase